MAYPKKVRSRKGRTYEYLAESTWVNGRTVQKYLGKAGESKVVKSIRENISPVGPILADEIRKAELRWPEEWLLEAIKEAAINNKLSWAYVVTICNRYEREGFTPPRREIAEGMMRGIFPPKKEPASLDKFGGFHVIKGGLGNKNAQGPRPRTQVTCRRCGRQFNAVIPKSRAPRDVCQKCVRAGLK
jgi:hypothetical protein